MKRVEMTWTEFSEALGLDYKGLDEQAISESAWAETDSFVNEYEAEEEVELTEDQKEEVLYMIEAAISDHWSMQNVLQKVLNIDELVEDVNEWGSRGPQMAIYDRELPAGTAISDWGATDEGLKFVLEEPFIVAFTEAVYGALGIGDEGYELDDMEGKEIAATMRRILECEGRSIRLDLDRWDEMRTEPSYWDLQKMLEGGRMTASRSITSAIRMISGS